MLAIYAQIWHILDILLYADIFAFQFVQNCVMKCSQLENFTWDISRKLCWQTIQVSIQFA